MDIKAHLGQLIYVPTVRAEVPGDQRPASYVGWTMDIGGASRKINSFVYSRSYAERPVFNLKTEIFLFFYSVLENGVF